MVMSFLSQTPNESDDMKRMSLVLVMMVILASFLVSCGERNTKMEYPQEVALVGQPANSPSSLYVLHVVEIKMEDGLYQSFQVYGADNELLYEPEEYFSVQSTNFFLWDDADRVWVYSGDLGTFFWEYDDVSRKWIKFTYADSEVSAPDFLKSVRPRWHQK